MNIPKIAPSLIEAGTFVLISIVNEYCAKMNILSSKITLASCILSTATLLLLSPATDRAPRHQRFRFSPCRGLTIGSTLVPLYLSSISAFRCREGVVHTFTEVMACLGCASSFTYTLGSFIWTLRGKHQKKGNGHSIQILENESTSVESYAIYFSGFVTPVIVATLFMYFGSDIDRNQQISRNTRSAYLLSGFTYTILHSISCSFIYSANLRLPFTAGEFIAFLTLFELLTSDYVVRYLIPYAFSSMIFLEPAQPYFAVSHGGVFGCFVGVIACYWLPRKAFMQSYYWTYRSIFACLVAFVFVEIALISAENKNQMHSKQFKPVSVCWIIDFLISPVGISSNHDLHHRVVWLIYWASIITVSFPISLVIAKKIKKSTSIISTVIGRKYFHLIAVFLFAPVTLFSPSMMFLSYAVALSLLIILELVRTSNASLTASKQESISPKCEKTGFLSPVINALNSFYDVFLDEKDLCGCDFVVTHATLIFGCALPLWTCSSLLEYFPPDTNDSNFFSILSLLGVVVIGVGDSFGALIGSLFGRTRWPGTKRTFEGSLSMLVSTTICFGLISRRLDDLKAISVSEFRKCIKIYVLQLGVAVPRSPLIRLRTFVILFCAHM